MAVKNPPAILDDSLKAEPEEDRLGYRDFAKRLATSLSAIRADNGYVVGLQGPWGSGKSTVLNFVKAYLRQGERDRDLVVVDFAPWLISGHQDLIAGFFKVLGEAVSFSDALNEAQSRREATGGEYEAIIAFAEGILTPRRSVASTHIWRRMRPLLVSGRRLETYFKKEELFAPIWFSVVVTGPGESR